MRALIVIVGLFAIVGVAAAAAPKPFTIERTDSPVAALTQDGDMLAWLSGDRTKCNGIEMSGGGNTYTLPQPQNTSLTCHWNMAAGIQRLAIAAGAPAALWTLHEGGSGSDYVLTAVTGGKEIKVERLVHQSDGTGWWLGGIAGGGSTLAYSSVDVTYVDPLGCGSGGSCAKKITDGGIDLVSAGQKTAVPHADPALALSVNGGRIAYIPATAVSKAGAPVSGPGGPVRVIDASDGSLVSQVSTVGVPVAIGLSGQVLGVLSRNGSKLRLTWYDPSNGAKLGGVGVPSKTAHQIAVSDQAIVYRVTHFFKAVMVSSGHMHGIGRTLTRSVGLSLDNGRLIWAESSHTAGRIRGLNVP